MKRITLKDETRVAGRSRWLFYALIVALPAWIAVGMIHSMMEGVSISDAAGASYSRIKDVSPVAFSFALAIFSYYVLSLRAYNFNQKSALFHKERIMEYEDKILSKVSGHIDNDSVDQLYFTIKQYEYNLKKLEESGFYPGKPGEGDFYRQNYDYLVSMVEKRVKDATGDYPPHMPKANKGDD